MLDEISEDRGFDVRLTMVPMPIQGSHDKYQYGLTETKTMEEIGRLATALFTLLQQQAQTKAPPMMGSVVIKKPVVAVDEISATKEQTLGKVDSGPQVNRERVEQEIESYCQQIQLLSQAAVQDRQRLKTQEQIETIQQYNRNFQSAFPAANSKADLLQKIAYSEQGIKLAQEKILELQQTLQDIQG